MPPRIQVNHASLTDCYLPRLIERMDGVIEIHINHGAQILGVQVLNAVGEGPFVGIVWFGRKV